jgi:phenylpropionate dioxygenase-like ring-hydroxylating dioxygenase large terminal subunit
MIPIKMVSILLVATVVSFAEAFHVSALTSPHLVPSTIRRPLSIHFSTLDSRTVDRDPVWNDDDDNVGAWIPIASAHALHGLGPQQIRVMGLDLVVWNSDEKAESKWSVMADTCPHRLAPLSQGRVDPETGCIECPYHGWQFDTEGNLTRLPHAEPDTRIDRIAGSRASYFPTHLAGDMIFAFLPSSVHGEMFLQSVLPEDMYPTVRHDMRTNKTYFARELPYSADFVIENFMDPSHIPFAHHALQSLRSDASPVPMSILVSNFTHVETSFEDYSRGVKRV